MTTYSKLALGALLCTLTAQPALAEGWYGGPFAMVGSTDQDHYGRSPASPLPVTGATDTGGISGGAGLWGGYDFDGISLELAGSYRARHDANFTFTDTTLNPAAYGAKANVQTADLMLSALYDLPLGWKLQPYVGGGAGFVYSHLNSQLLGAGITSGGDNSDWDTAWQVQGGFKYPLSATSQLRIDYRYIDLGRIETGVLPTGTNDKLSADLTSQDVRIGMVWNF